MSAAFSDLRCPPLSSPGRATTEKCTSAAPAEAADPPRRNMDSESAASAPEASLRAGDDDDDEPERGRPVSDTRGGGEPPGGPDDPEGSESGDGTETGRRKRRLSRACGGSCSVAYIVQMKGEGGKEERDLSQGCHEGGRTTL